MSKETDSLESYMKEYGHKYNQQYIKGYEACIKDLKYIQSKGGN